VFKLFATGDEQLCGAVIRELGLLEQTTDIQNILNTLDKLGVTVTCLPGFEES
jgi:hypothetical protein